MRKFLNKFRRHDIDAQTIDTPDENITIQQVFHYRKQKGVNLGTFLLAHFNHLTNASHQVPGSFLNVGLLTARSNMPSNLLKATSTWLAA